DEFQDTNSAQYRLLVQLVPDTEPNLFAVADDDQIIYQWNGASPARLEELRKRFNMPIIQLPENFRCRPEVIDIANNLIRHNSDRAADKQPLSAHKSAGAANGIRLHGFADFDSEVAWLAEDVGQLVSSERSRSVILAR